MPAVESMSPRERILTAYRRRGLPDRVPISPWLVSLIPDRLSKAGTLWERQLETFEYFGVDGIIRPMPERRTPVEVERIITELSEGETELVQIYKTPKGELREVFRSSPEHGYDQITEGAVKDLLTDLPLYMDATLPNPAEITTDNIKEINKVVGDRALVEGYVCLHFLDFVITARNGGVTQTIYDLYDHGDFFEELRDKFERSSVGIARRILEDTGVEALFVGCGGSSLSAIGPDLWRKWNKAGLAAICSAAHESGAMVHIHQHGPCLEIMDDIIEAGVDVVDPLEPPPGGDVHDRKEVKSACGSRIAFRGNVDPLQVLWRGTPEQIEQEVRTCIEDLALGGGFVLSTGEEVSGLTPYENIFAFVEAGKKFGQY